MLPGVQRFKQEWDIREQNIQSQKQEIKCQYCNLKIHRLDFEFHIDNCQKQCIKKQNDNIQNNYQYQSNLKQQEQLYQNHDVNQNSHNQQQDDLYSDQNGYCPFCDTYMSEKLIRQHMNNCVEQQNNNDHNNQQILQKNNKNLFKKFDYGNHQLDKDDLQQMDDYINNQNSEEKIFNQRKTNFKLKEELQQINPNVRIKNEYENNYNITQHPQQQQQKNRSNQLNRQNNSNHSETEAQQVINSHKNFLDIFEKQFSGFNYKREQRLLQEQDEYINENDFIDNGTIINANKHELKQFINHQKQIEEEIKHQKEFDEKVKERKRQKELYIKLQQEELYMIQKIQIEKQRKKEKERRENSKYFVQAINKEDNEQCCICLDDMQKNTEIAILQCMHKFHVNCIKDWMKSKKQCPYCKTKIG